MCIAQSLKMQEVCLYFLELRGWVMCVLCSDWIGEVVLG